MRAGIPSILALSIALQTQLQTVAAGEIFIHNDPTCKQGYTNNYFTFAVSASTGCIPWKSSYNYLGMRSARVMSPQCTVKAYYDQKCSKLAHTIDTSSGSGKCLPVSGGIQGIIATCNPSKTVPRDLSADSTDFRASAPPAILHEVTRLAPRGASNALDNGNIFYNPPVTWDGFPAGDQGVYIQDVSYFGGGGGPPQGALSADAQYMTEQLLSVTQGSRNNSVTIHRTTPSNIRYELELDAHGILADGVVSAMGPAVIAAVFADAIEGLAEQAQSTILFRVRNQDGEVYATFTLDAIES